MISVGTVPQLGPSLAGVVHLVTGRLPHLPLARKSGDPESAGMVAFPTETSKQGSTFFTYSDVNRFPSRDVTTAQAPLPHRIA